MLQRFKILEPLPKDREGIEKLVDLLYERMLRREDEAIDKLYKVMELGMKDECEFLQNLYFFAWA